jgi:hypothetical protein
MMQVISFGKQLLMPNILIGLQTYSSGMAETALPFGKGLLGLHELLNWGRNGK